MAGSGLGQMSACRKPGPERAGWTADGFSPPLPASRIGWWGGRRCPAVKIKNHTGMAGVQPVQSGWLRLSGEFNPVFSTSPKTVRCPALRHAGLRLIRPDGLGLSASGRRRGPWLSGDPAGGRMRIVRTFPVPRFGVGHASRDCGWRVGPRCGGAGEGRTRSRQVS